jgi:hypothetical protein
MEDKGMPSIFKRISDIVAANINDLIDRVEDPERMIKQSSRPGESHPQALTEPDVNVSAHPALTVQPPPSAAIASEQIAPLANGFALSKGSSHHWLTHR